MSPAASGVGRTKSVQRVVDLHRHSATSSGGGPAGIDTAPSSETSHPPSCGDPRLYRQLSRSDLVGAVSRGDRCDDKPPPRVVAQQ
jgi:hypothetical protein